MIDAHEILKRNAQLRREVLKRRDDELTKAVAAERRDGETEAQCIDRMHRAAHPAIKAYYGIEETDQ